MLGDNLKNLREERQLMQRDIASYIHKSVQAYSQYELNKREPDLDTLIMLADFYHVSTDDILGRNRKKSVDYFYFEDLNQSLSKQSIEKIKEYINLICLMEKNTMKK